MAGDRDEVEPTPRDRRAKEFGRHVRALRRARGLTQEILAERSGPSSDTIRRLEHGSFSPSLDTLRKLCTGLRIDLSTLFTSIELSGDADASTGRDLAAGLRSVPDHQRPLALALIRQIFDLADDNPRGTR